MYKKMLIGGIIGASMGTVAGYMKKNKRCRNKDKCGESMLTSIIDMF